MTSVNDMRPQMHRLWAGVAAGWNTYADEIDTGRADLTATLLDRADLHPGDRVLELACGPGGVGLAAAARVAPGGEVILSDAVPEMTAIAARRAAERGVADVRVAVMDFEELTEPDGSLDAVLCREGLMFALDHRRAAREIHRVLRPGGRVAVAVWGDEARNPWLGLLLAAVREQVDRPVPPPGVPGPFGLGDPAELAAVLADGGLVDVVVDEHPAAMGGIPFEHWWTRTSTLAGPLGSMLAAMPEAAREAVRARMRRDAAPFTAPDGTIDLPGVSLVASARRP